MSRFEKVSFEQFTKDFFTLYKETVITTEELKEIYNNIKLPQRATTASAGYDFYSPWEISLDNQYIICPTGIRWVSNDPSLVLLLMPRSGLGFKYGLHLRNTIGVIDADYAGAKNEGHIMAKVAAEDPCQIKVGEGFMQGIIVPFAATDTEVTPGAKRDGGFGSTTEVK